MNSKYKMNIGIEIHCVLNTRTKLFSSSINSDSSKNYQPNTNISPLDLAYPGSTPTPNKRSIILGIRALKLLNMQIADFLRFDRKHYFYPDLPKGYQVTQFYKPIGTNGTLILDNDKKITIDKLILEEDTAQQFHIENQTYLDFNRAGRPLLEIVTDAYSIKNEEDAINYIFSLRNLLQDNGITNGQLENGDLRCDINISVNKIHQKELGTKVEIKNLNSLSNIKKAIKYEYTRQTIILEKNQVVSQETRRYDEASSTTILIRKKTNEVDYRYLTDPSFGKYFFSKNDHLEAEKNLINDGNEILMKYNSNPEIIKALNSNFLLRKLFFCLYLNTNSELIKQYLGNFLINTIATFDKNLILKIHDYTSQEYINLFKLIELRLNKTINNIDVFKLELNKLFNNPSKYKFEALKDSIDYTLEVSKIFLENKQLISNYADRPERVLNFVKGQIMKKYKGKANPLKINESIKVFLKDKI